MYDALLTRRANRLAIHATIRGMPKCPYCKQVVTLDKTRRETADVSVPEGVHREISGIIKKEIMYSCPHCDSILGFGFFLGGLLTDRP